MVDSAFIDHYRCPPEFAQFGSTAILSAESGYFKFGTAIGYGRHADAQLSGNPPSDYPDLSNQASWDGRRINLPFDLSEVVANLQLERYQQASPRPLGRMLESRIAQRLYYSCRPLLPVGVRKHLQRARLKGWTRIPFPRWPIEDSVGSLLDRAMMARLSNSLESEIPFTWFWPDGASACVVMTHDVENERGLSYCEELMSLDEQFGVRAAFQLVPEGRYSVSDRVISQIRERGHEVNVHDLDHDGRLFESQSLFRERARKLNEYGRIFKSRGFRAAVMYRNQEWFDALQFAYDMSVPNVAHLEPQRGGCCTVMPYFVGNVLELPLTTIQDYSLFHILGDYSIDLWKQQIDLIMSKHGLITFNTHPDYLIPRRARAVYEELLDYLRELRARHHLWMALPADVDRWWRNRRRLEVVAAESSWIIRGEDNQRARLALASIRSDRLEYSVGRNS